ncbi:MAG TPA: hypothetical protein VKJ65_10455 [Phycisphaerae bacterium]|nr:hypothetical protein [Phycisphaerae bacterium]
MNRPVYPRRSLNELLENISENRQEIFTAIYRLAARQAASIVFRNPQDRHDASSEAAIYAINKIDRYNPQRRSAFTYFGRLLSRRLFYWLRTQEKHWAVHDLAENEQHQSESLFDSGGKELPRLPHKPRTNYRILAEDEREKVRRLLDLALHEAQAVVENTTDEQEMQRGQIAVGILQQIRKRLLGRFNRVTSDHENSAKAA